MYGCDDGQFIRKTGLYSGLETLRTAAGNVQLRGLTSASLRTFPPTTVLGPARQVQQVPSSPALRARSVLRVNWPSTRLRPERLRFWMGRRRVSSDNTATNSRRIGLLALALRAMHCTGLTVWLAAFWFLIMGALGVYFPFFTLYLRENVGLSGGQIGLVTAALPLTGMVFQPFWGQVADRTGSRTRTLALLALGAALGYAFLTIPRSFTGLLAAVAFLAVFSTSLIPTGVSVSLATLEATRINDFGRVRVWGTIGYLCTVVAVPRLLRFYQKASGLSQVPGGPSEPNLELIFFVAGALVTLGALVAWRLPRTGSVALRASRDDYLILLRHSAYLRVLVFTFFCFLFIQGPMILFPIYVRSRGGDMDAVSLMWIWMLLLEIPLMARVGSVFKRVGPRVMVASAAIAGGVRWLACAVFHDLAIIYPIQLLHAVVVVGLLAGAPLYIEVLIPERLRSTGQGLLMTLGSSIGGIVSVTVSGTLVDRFGADVPFLLGGLGAIAVGCAAPLILPVLPRTGR